ncbi:MAG: hypothetical protein H7Y88_11965 [Phycisphaerales bacterium]|nr:hypothetical protein [Phycisphaerales bacterium]
MSTTAPVAAHPYLIDLTQLPTAAGREDRVIRWVRDWAARHPSLALAEDRAGNLIVTRREAPPSSPDNPPLYITAHLDHPAFVVERIVGPGTLELSFRGGVMDAFFEHAPVRVYPRSVDAADGSLPAVLTGPAPGVGSPFGKLYIAELDSRSARAASTLAVGDVATWELPPARVIDGNLHTHACDDLAALAAAVCTMERLIQAPATQDVRLLFTRAEEIGFLGAIAACKLGTMPRGSRVLALENSRAFPDSPIGGGPIVRVGDRISIFHPQLTAACAKRAEELFARPATPHASQTTAQIGVPAARPWQRKLMAGGACEASVFCSYGYASTCLCLPLGNYHNMAHLAELQAGTYDAAKLGPPRAAPEFISVDDFNGLVDLLVGLGQSLPTIDPGIERFEKLWSDKKGVLGASPLG